MVIKGETKLTEDSFRRNMTEIYHTTPQKRLNYSTPLIPMFLLLSSNNNNVCKVIWQNNLPYLVDALGIPMHLEQKKRRRNRPGHQDVNLFSPGSPEILCDKFSCEESFGCESFVVFWKMFCCNLQRMMSDWNFWLHFFWYSHLIYFKGCLATPHLKNIEALKKKHLGCCFFFHQMLYFRLRGFHAGWLCQRSYQIGLGPNLQQEGVLKELEIEIALCMLIIVWQNMYFLQDKYSLHDSTLLLEEA